MSSAKKFKEKGNVAFKGKQWEESIYCYTEAIKFDPDNHSYYSNRSAAYLKIGDMESALEDANICIRLNPSYYKGYGRKGAAYHAMKQYDHACAAYKEGLKICPDEDNLKMGLAAAKRARLDTSAAQKAARKTATTRRAQKSRSKKAKKAENVSAFVKQTRMELQLQKAAIEAQLDLIDELAAMTDEQKMDLLFNLIDNDGDGTVDATELAAALRKRNAGMSFTDSLERAINMVAVFDKDGDAKLDTEEFSEFVGVMLGELGLNFNEFAEFLVLQILFSESEGEEEEVDASEINDEVKAREQLFDILADERMVELFKLFDKDGSRSLSFREVALGLYQMTQNMEESAKTTMELLLMMDKNDQRELNYEQFGRLIMAIVAAAESTFDEIADELTLQLMTCDSITEEDLQNLVIADSMYEAATVMNEETGSSSGAVDALGFSRLQKLFDVWDDDKSGSISFSELVEGLHKFQTAAGIETSAEEQAEALLKFDADGDDSLDRQEFAKAMVSYAKAWGIALHDLIEFMVVASLLGEDQIKAYQAAYKRSITGENVPAVQAVNLEYYEDNGEED